MTIFYDTDMKRIRTALKVLTGQVNNANVTWSDLGYDDFHGWSPAETDLKDRAVEILCEAFETLNKHIKDES